MAATPPHVPQYSLHRATGQAVVRLQGKDRYLGRHGTPESQAKYRQLIAEWLAAGGRPPTEDAPGCGPGATGLTVNEVFLAYWNFVQTYYRKNDQPTSEVRSIKLAMRDLLETYGFRPALDFGPLALKAVRQLMIDRRISRGVINQDLGRIKRMFKWATENQLVPPSVLAALQAVAGLRRGRSLARETEPVKPVPEDHVGAVLQRVVKPVAAMIRLQLVTGMRPGEVVVMRGGDLDTTGRVWAYTPAGHKTEHHGHSRNIYLGPKAKKIIAPYLKRDLLAFLFSPAEALAELRARRHAARKTPLSCGNRPGTNKRAHPKKRPREHYDTASYRRAIDYACKKAGVPKWHPHQLRHNAATHLRKEFGLDVARVVLGHHSPAVTEVYAELDQAKAMQTMAEVG